ncbi:MAG TPA: HD domain-containing protein, partial [Ktedonobacteraceae bacterium]|nr:HD domain-containing protein [Ktedonobacteraceae bacterium]
MINTSLHTQLAAEETTNKQAQQLLEIVLQNMPPAEVELVSRALQLARDTCEGVQGERAIPPLEHALAIATILAQIMHIDAIGVASGLVFEAVDSDLLSLEDVETKLGAPVARVVGSMLRMNILERKQRVGAQLNAPEKTAVTNTATSENENT